MDHRGHQQPGGLAEVDQFPQGRVGQDGTGITKIAQDDPDSGIVSDQGRRVLADHRVVVCVDHPALRIDLMHDLVRVTDGRQPGADVDELADPALGYPFRGPLVKAAVGPRAVPQLRDEGGDPVGRVPVSLEVVLAA